MTTDEPDQPLLSPEEDARVRRLLAEARAAGPVPPGVAARLDETLVGLAAARAAAGAAEPTIAEGYDAAVRPLVRTRRHRVAAIIGAAAAVAVVALAVGAFFDRSEPAAQDASSAESPVERGENAGDAGAVDAETLDEAPEATQDPGEPARTLATDQPAQRVRARHLAVDLARLQQTVLPHSATADYGRTMLTAPAGFICDSADWGPGVLVAVRYDGKPAIVAFREPMGRSQVAEVLQCGTAEVLRSTTIATTD